MGYYIVETKCGHVGRGKYYKAEFPVIADNAKEAAKKVRNYSRVKRDHKDAILNVDKVDEEVYDYYLEEYENQIYFKCNNKKEQKEHWNEIEPYVFNETDRAMKKLQEHNNYYKVKKNTKGIRNPYKYAKYNLYVA